MYKTKKLTHKELRNVTLHNQDYIRQYTQGELDLVAVHELIKQRSKDFTIPNAKAERADAYLWAIYKGEASPIETENRIVFSDGFSFTVLSKKEAKKRFKKKEQVFALNTTEETEHLITQQEDFEQWELFGIPDAIKKEVKKKRDPSRNLSKEALQIKRKKQESRLRLIKIELALKKQKISA
ncbi:hypothetical protein [Aquimarina pacifica]|uniref:hypothetical protein n=1 Tax=Aquimarina pacifica TaxID=1296415 RepID=UPI000470C4EA|nr:hypothetical protein [Aquimarina pacifica]